MDNLSQLQNLWKNIQPNQNANLDFMKSQDTILKKIKNTEKAVLRVNILKTIAISILLLSIVWLVVKQGQMSVIGIVSVVLVVCSIAAMMIIYWKIQFKSSDLNHQLPQIDFINDTISIIYKRRQQFFILFRIFVVALIFEMNLLYFDLLSDLAMGIRIIYHVTLTMFLILTYLVGLKIREKKFNRDFKPLIDDLNAVKNDNN